MVLPRLVVVLAVFGLYQTSAINTGLLASTLFTFHEHACDGESLHVRCPYHTTISIQFAQYGRQVPSHDMCPYKLPINTKSRLLRTAQVENTNCLATTSLQILLDKCQDKRQCRIQASPDVFGEDPCPETGKYLEVAYKCRPNEFRSRVTCEGEDMVLRCKKSFRIAIYSAMFGRSQKGNLECPARREVDSECQSSTSLEEVMNLCLGKRHCTIPSNEKTFGDPCQPGTPKYLNVIYTCVPKRILKELQKSEGERETSEERGGGRHEGRRGGNGNNNQNNGNNNNNNNNNNSSQGQRNNGRRKNNGHRKNHRNRDRDQGSREREKEDRNWEEEESPGTNGEPSYVPKPSTFNYNILTPATTAKPGLPKNTITVNGTKIRMLFPWECNNTRPSVGQTKKDPYIGFISDWIQTVAFIQSNFEKFILYLVLGFVVGLLCVLTLIIVRLTQTKRRREKRAKLDISEPVPQNGNRTHGPGPPTDTFDRSDAFQDGIEILSFNSRAPLRNEPATRSLNNYYG